MVTLTPEEWEAYKAQLETMDHAQLVYEAKRWRFDCDLLRMRHRSILASTDALLAEDRRRLALIWALIDVRKKTVSTEALLEIFRSNVLADIPPVPAKPTEPGDPHLQVLPQSHPARPPMDGDDDGV